MNALTHLMVGLSIAYVWDKRILTASIFAVVPTFDSILDFTHPFVENGILHSLPAAGVSALLIYTYSEDIESAQSCIIGYITHLSLDIVSSTDINFLFPFFKSFSLDIIPKNSLWWNIAIISLSLTAMFLKKNSEIIQPFVNNRRTS